jgi:hypothetical protein
VQSFGGTKTFDGGLVSDLLAGSTHLGHGIQTRTRGNMTLYVDPTGSDSATCLTVGAPCLSVEGALAKLPRVIEHAVRVEVANGTYSPPIITGLYVGSRATATSNQDTDGGSLVVSGQMTLATLGAGPNSFVATGGFAGDETAPPSVSFSAGTWTPNALRGLHLRNAAGSVLAISDNTATTINYVIGAFVPVNGTALDIVTPGAVFSSATNTMVVALEGPGFAALRNIRIARTGGSALSVSLYNSIGQLNIENSQVTSNSSGVFVSGGRVSVLRTAIATSTGPLSFNGGIGHFVGASYLQTTSTTNWGIFSSLPSFFGLGANTINTGALGLILPPGRSTVTGLWVTCTGGPVAGSIGIGTNGPTPVALEFNGNVRITGCESGLRATGPVYMRPRKPHFSGVTNAFVAEKGGRIQVVDVPVFTGVTAEALVDGVATTMSAIDALTPQVTPANAFGSWVGR